MTLKEPVSSEKTLLLKSAVPGANPAELLEAVRESRVDWNRLYALADRHQMVGIIAPRFLKTLNGFMPEQTRAQWKNRWRFLAMRDLAQTAALQEILEAARAQDLRPILLKGLAVHLQAYPLETARGASDIDLLVRLQDAPALIHCLEAAGFRSLSDWRSHLKRTHEASFHRGQEDVSIDLHWSLCAPAEEYAAGLTLSDSIRKGTRRLSLGNTSCAIPGREEELLFLCLHLLKMPPFRLRGLSDLLHLLLLPPPVDWDRFLSLARKTGTGAAAYYALGMAAQLSEGSVPAQVPAALARRSGPRWLLSPSLQLERLLDTHGEERSNLSLRWRGVFFAGRAWVWLPYQTALHGKRLLRQIQAVLR